MPEPSPSAQASVDAPAAHQPYVPDHVVLPEFTWPAVLVGAVLGIVFGASSLYLVLKVGMTVSASIPVAVLSITLFRVFSRLFGFRPASILENNIVQTTGSAGESIAFGVGVTMPAVMILGFEMEITRVMVVSVLGGLLGILMMIPLRRAFIVKQHGKLVYPEGTACADVLIIGETGGATAKTVFAGFGIAFVYQILMLGLKLWKDMVSQPLGLAQRRHARAGDQPRPVGRGLHHRHADFLHHGGRRRPLLAGVLPGDRLLRRGTHRAAGALGKPAGPRHGRRSASRFVRDLHRGRRGGRRRNHQHVPRPAADPGVDRGGHPRHAFVAVSPLPQAGEGPGVRADGRMATAQALTLALSRRERGPDAAPTATCPCGSSCSALWRWCWRFGSFSGSIRRPAAVGRWPPCSTVVNLAAAVLIVLFGFLFVTVSSRLTGEIGSSSNPISGMVVATLLLTCLIFLILGWTAPQYRLIAISIAAVVCIASSNGGTTSQDLKTGFLVGATPKWQQLSILVGSVSSALVIGVILLVMNASQTVYSRKDLPQPKQPFDMAQLKATARQEQAPDDPHTYYVWHATEGNAEDVPPGKYLVDDRGRICWLVDPGINGRLTHRDDGTEVRKYPQPQARLVRPDYPRNSQPETALDPGAAGRDRRGGRGTHRRLVVGVCGGHVPAAVVLDADLRRRPGAVRRRTIRPQSSPSGRTAELESEMSPGVLFSTGYIAGGTIAGVLIAFCNFSDKLTAAMASVGEHVPHQSATALVTFLLLAVFLVLVGRGWVLKSR